MKSILKPVIISTSISVLALCCSVSYAKANSTAHELSRMQHVYALPKLSSEGISRVKPKHFNSFGQMLDKPMLRIPLNESPLFKKSLPSKKNEFFEMATIFNDKLQQLMASIQNGLSNKSSDQQSLSSDSSIVNCKSSQN